MKIFPINKKPHLLNNEACRNMRSIIEKMNKQTTTSVSRNGYLFSTIYVTEGALKANNNAVCYSPLTKLSFIRFNKRNYIANGVTGEIQPENKTVFETIFGLSKKTIQGINETINNVKDNFENSKIVKQYRLVVEGMTRSGFEALKSSQDIAHYKNRTEKLIQSKW